MSLFQEAFSAEPLFPTPSSPSLSLPRQHKPSRRPLLDWEPPESKDTPAFTALLNPGKARMAC